MIEVLRLLLTFGSYLICDSAFCCSSKSLEEIVLILVIVLELVKCCSFTNFTLQKFHDDTKIFGHHSKIRIMNKAQSFCQCKCAAYVACFASCNLYATIAIMPLPSFTQLKFSREFWVSTNEKPIRVLHCQRLWGLYSWVNYYWLLFRTVYLITSNWHTPSLLKLGVVDQFSAWALEQIMLIFKDFIPQVNSFHVLSMIWVERL